MHEGSGRFLRNHQSRPSINDAASEIGNYEAAAGSVLGKVFLIKLCKVCERGQEFGLVLPLVLWYEALRRHSGARERDLRNKPGSIGKSSRKDRVSRKVIRHRQHPARKYATTFPNPNPGNKGPQHRVTEFQLSLQRVVGGNTRISAKESFNIRSGDYRASVHPQPTIGRS